MLPVLTDPYCYNKEYDDYVWDLTPIKRGNEIDMELNKHNTTGLGRNFPVADRVENRTLISTKSMDLGMSSYRNPADLRNTLYSYARKLEGFEEKYFKNSDVIKKGNGLRRDEYDKMMLEIVVPPMILSEDIINEMNIFKKAMDARGIEISFLIGVYR